MEGFCGTAGCAMGEFPAIFPGTWRFMGMSVDLINSKYLELDEQVAEFLGVTDNEATALFWPCKQEGYPELLGLTGRATRFQVAENVRRFLKARACQILNYGTDTSRKTNDDSESS